MNGFFTGHPDLDAFTLPQAKSLEASLLRPLSQLEQHWITVKLPLKA